MKQVAPILYIPRRPTVRQGAATVFVDMYFGSSLMASVNNSSCLRFRPADFQLELTLTSYYQICVPVPSLRTLNSSNVGSQTKSSHIWQNTPPLLESASIHMLMSTHPKRLLSTYTICALSMFHVLGDLWQCR